MSNGKMNRVAMGWRRLLVGLLPVGLALVACSSPTDVPTTTAVPSTETEKVATLQPEAQVATIPGQGNETSSDESDLSLTINVDLTDDGFAPASIFLSQGQRVKLVFRNRGTAEHHYRVVGLLPTNLLWRSEPEGVQEEGVSDEDHDLHHTGGFVPWRGTSPAGIKPLGFEVHGYAVAGGVDAVVFTPTNSGTFMVQDPLHPEMVGKVTVFSS